ncbi:MAG: GNAT family N-acetyltransferase [Planctomycetaceae bacterium]|nr:GNAT family N-acetyltransferase [Planctomycetaceae bacterium]
MLTLSCPIYPSYRVHQVAGLFDVPLADKAERTLQFDTPPLDADWNIGCIVGPSGSGKSTIARHLFKQNYSTGYDWQNDRAVIDNFADLPIKDIIQMLTLVGFSSPPSWLKPYRVLSNGEKFRCDLAQALLQGGRVVFDEYTSVVDRNVAQIASAALAKAIHGKKMACQFVAVTCHYDILDWLEPDWILDTATGNVAAVPLCGAQERRRLRRPNIELEVFHCDRSLWTMFKPYHYLNGNLAKSCRCYSALWNGQPVAFCAVIALQGLRNWYRVSRIVTLPDYQGVGIGSALLDTLGGMYAKQGFRFSITASHPSVLSHCKRSEHWRASQIRKTGSENSRGRAVVSFEYC